MAMVLPSVCKTPRKILFLAYTGLFFVASFIFINQVQAATFSALYPNDPVDFPVTTCGEISVAGTYTLDPSFDIDSLDNRGNCFVIDSYQIAGGTVVINGANLPITSGGGNLVVDARAYNTPGDTTSGLLDGASANVNIVLRNINFSGFSSLVNASGNDDTDGLGVNGGNGGKGGNVTIAGTNLDLSNTTISIGGGTGVNGLNPAGNLTITYSGTYDDLGLVYMPVSILNMNGVVTYPANGAWTAHGPSLDWTSVTSSLDGMKLAAVAAGGRIYTSTDSGITWNMSASSPVAYWHSIASSADGHKLVAVVDGGKIYNSNDSGSTWIVSTSSPSKVWWSVASSGDGNKLVAVVGGGHIYTSNNSGVTWISSTSSPSVLWSSIASSYDGTKLVATVYGGQIYSSTDSGLTWNVDSSSPSLNWESVASSYDGKDITAVVHGGQIYTSTDFGDTWDVDNSPSGNWYSVSSSQDGTKLVAVMYGGQIYTSTDSGSNWDVDNSSPTEVWWSVTSSGDGSRLAAVGYGGQIYTYQDVYSPPTPTLPLLVSIISPADTGTTTSTTWSPSVNWDVNGVGNLILCRYSYDSGATTTVDCANGGSDIPAPSSFGHHVLSVLASNGTATATQSSSFEYDQTQLEVSIISPADMGTTTSTTWSPSVNWDVNGVDNLILCRYSYDSGATTTVDCANGGSDILAPVGEGIHTLNIEAISSSSDTRFISYASSTFAFKYDWTSYGGLSLGWSSITSSIDGTKLAAVTDTGDIYTSTSSGLIWEVSMSSSTIHWHSITSSADGTKLAAVDYGGIDHGGHIYLSTNSGSTWHMSLSSPIEYWHSITSSIDGTKLAASTWHGQIYTSTDSGSTWNMSGISPPENMYSDLSSPITSSADGSKLFTAPWNGHIYTSKDYGATWSVSTSSPQAFWSSITTSSDGKKVAAVINGGQIYTSNDYGATWSVSTSSPTELWTSITSSADGTKLVAVINGGQIYTSNDFGLTWDAGTTPYGYWSSLTSSANGKKMAAVDYGGLIYTIDTISSSSPLIISNHINYPTEGLSVSSTTWNPNINWDTNNTDEVVTCQYSYSGANNKTTTTVDCANGGRDITIPSNVGTTTLYIKSINIYGERAIDSVTFAYVNPADTNPPNNNPGGNSGSGSGGSSSGTQGSQSGGTSSNTPSSPLAPVQNEPPVINNTEPNTEPPVVNEPVNANPNPVTSPDNGGAPGAPDGSGGSNAGGNSGGAGGSSGGSSGFSTFVLNVSNSIGQQIGSAIITSKKIAQKTAEVTAVIVKTPASKAVEATGAVTGVATSVILYANTAFATPLSTSEFFFIPVRLWGLILVGLGLRKRVRPWGTVYDSVTKRPIDPAVVTAKDANGNVVAESITDIDGRYGFFLPEGTYYISAQKSNYDFPSIKMKGVSFDELYDDLYFGEPVTIKSGQVLDKNIPMDQKNFDWNEQAKVDQGNLSFHSRHEKTFAMAGNVVYGIGFLISLATAVFNQSPYNIMVLGLYSVILLIVRFGIKVKKLGIILDKLTKKPLSYSIVRVFTPDRQVSLRSSVSDARGKYYCIVPKGDYSIDIEKKNTDGTYSKVYESSNVSSKKGIINDSFNV